MPPITEIPDWPAQLRYYLNSQPTTRAEIAKVAVIAVGPEPGVINAFSKPQLHLAWAGTLGYGSDMKRANA